MPSKSAILVLTIALGWLCGCGAMTYRASVPLETMDWVALDSGSSASLRGLSVVDDRVIWASGSEGVVLRTMDGGESWEQLEIPNAAEMDFRDVHAFDAQTAFVMGITEPACVLRTLDGGATWDAVFVSQVESDFFDSLSFFDRRRACLFGDPQAGVFTVLGSVDAGSAWQRVQADQLPPALEGEAAFAASGTCIATRASGQAWIATGGEQARVLRSDDYGRSWFASETPMLAGGTSGIYSVAFRDAKHGVIVGGDYSKPEEARQNVAYSVDGGVNWIAVDSDKLVGGYRSCVAWVPNRPHTWVAVGRAGSDFSIDDGRTWHALGDEGFYAVGFSSNGTGFAVGSDGRIARLEL